MSYLGSSSLNRIPLPKFEFQACGVYPCTAPSPERIVSVALSGYFRLYEPILPPSGKIIPPQLIKLCTNTTDIADRACPDFPLQLKTAAFPRTLLKEYFVVGYVIIIDN